MDKRRIMGSEAEAFKRLYVASDILDGLRKELNERAGMVKWGRRDLAAASTLLNKVFAAMLETVPLPQLETMYRNMKASCFWTGVKLPGERSNSSEFGMILSWDTIAALTDAARSACITCDLTPDKQRQCPLAKALDELPVEKDETARGCGYYGRL